MTAHGSLPPSLGKGTTEEEAETVLQVLPIVENCAPCPRWHDLRQEV